MGFLEPVRDFDFLGAFLQAFAALGTLVGALVLRYAEGAVIHETPTTHVIVHDGVVINLKDAGDFYFVGTGLAVAAVGAGDGAQALIGFFYFNDYLKVFSGIKAGSGAVDDFNVFQHLLHGAHAA